MQKSLISPRLSDGCLRAAKQDAMCERSVFFLDLAELSKVSGCVSDQIGYSLVSEQAEHLPAAL